MELNRYIDHTLLKATATEADVVRLCKEAQKYGFFAVCIHPCYLPLAKNELKGTGVKIATVVGFPLGASAMETKIREAAFSIENGADEIDMVMNLGFFKSGWNKTVSQEIKEIKKAIGPRILKVIIEVCSLTDAEITTASQIVVNSGADFVKTSTGFGSGGATEHAVKLIREAVGDSIQIKASGGIKTAASARRYSELGGSRNCNSSGGEIVSLNLNQS